MSNREEILANDYEPYDNRQREGQTNRVETLIHLVKSVLGTGILALPEAYKHAGYVLAVVGFVIITIIATYCLHILFNAKYYLCKREKIPEMTYPEAMKQGFLMGPDCLKRFANAMPVVVNTFLIINQLGVMCVYTLFVASNVKQVVDVNNENGTDLSVEFYMVALVIPLLLTCYIKNLHFLAPISIIANWAIFASLICMHYFFFQDLVPLSNRDMFVPISTLPLFMGTVMFAMMSIGIILSIELNMKNGKYFGGLFGVLNQGMFICLVINMMVGFFGYWKYGQRALGSVTLNIDMNHRLAHIIRITYSAAIFMTFPLAAYPITEILWEQYFIQYMETSKHLLFWEYLTRSTAVFISFLLACFIPKLGLFISLFGAFCSAFLSLILPPILDICIRWPDDLGPKKGIAIRDILLTIFGVSAWGFGTYSSIEAIIDILTY